MSLKGSNCLGTGKGCTNWTTSSALAVMDFACPSFFSKAPEIVRSIKTLVTLVASPKACWFSFAYFLVFALVAFSTTF